MCQPFSRLELDWLWSEAFRNLFQFGPGPDHQVWLVPKVMVVVSTAFVESARVRQVSYRAFRLTMLLRHRLLKKPVEFSLYKMLLWKCR